MKVFACRAAVVVLLLTATSAPAVEWHPFTPDARDFASLTIDTLYNRAVLLGGALKNDVWEMTIDNSGVYYWNKLYPSGTPPPGRWGHRALYIPEDQCLLMIGGTGRGGQLNDVWALDLTRGSEDWEQLTPAGTPPSV